MGVAIVGLGLLAEAALEFLDNLPEPDPVPEPEPAPEPEPLPEPEPEPQPEPEHGDGVMAPPP